jgi:hypothetical protein
MVRRGGLASASVVDRGGAAAFFCMREEANPSIRRTLPAGRDKRVTEHGAAPEPLVLHASQFCQ